MLLDARIGALAYVPGRPVIEEAGLRVGEGERVVLVGPASSGKSSLLAACAGIVPRLVRPAQFQGEILLDGRVLTTIPSAELFERVGVVLQAVDDQLFDLSTEDLLAFPLENRGVEPRAIRAAVREIAARVGVTRLFGRRVLTLSGGERRLVALGAALAAGPRLLVLDEPMTGLDPEARARFATALAATRAGVLIAEQEVEALAPLVDRVLFQDAAGRLVGDEPAARAWRAEGLWSGCGVLAPFRSPARQAPATPGRGVLQAEGLVSRLARADGAPVLQGLDLTVREGEVVGLIGRNGAGKTTLFRLLLGLAEARAGRIVLDGEEAGGWAPGVRARRIGYLPQNARRLFFNLTLLEEVAFSLAPGGAATPELRVRAASLLEEVGLAERAEASPFALSPREQARLGLACLLAAEPRLAILDEPTLGRDQGGLAALASFLGRRRADGSAVLFASHDLRLVDAFCDRLLILHEGHIAFDGPVRQGWRSGAFAALGWPAPHADEAVA